MIISIRKVFVVMYIHFLCFKCVEFGREVNNFIVDQKVRTTSVNFKSEITHFQNYAVT